MSRVCEATEVTLAVLVVLGVLVLLVDGFIALLEFPDGLLDIHEHGIFYTRCRFRIELSTRKLRYIESSQLSYFSPS